MIAICISAILNCVLVYHKKLSKVAPPINIGHGFSELPETPSSPSPSSPSQPIQRLPDFVDVPEFRSSEDSVFGDIIAHSQEKPFGGASRSTNAHETAHGINSYLRNKYRQQTGKKVNGFYCLRGRGVIIEEPRMRKRQVNEFLPENLRSYRYSLYLEGQSEWDDTPLYLVDEWVAYVLGGMTNVDDVQTGRYNDGWTDGVSGCLDFSIYTIALCMAIEQHDPEYWKNNSQFRAFMVWWLKAAQQTYLLGHKMEQFKWDKQDRLLREFIASREAEPMRNFVQKNLEGIWLDTPLPWHSYQPFQRTNVTPIICRKKSLK